MKLEIKRQDEYSRGELLLRSFFGLFYIAIPHAFLMFFIGIYTGILQFLAFWVVLFTGKYPQSWFETQVKMVNWSARVNAVTGNLVDGYPAFGLDGTSDKVNVDVEYPQELSRLMLLVRAFFGWLYILVPHGFCLLFRLIATGFISFLAWWVVLFTGNYPEKWHSFNVGTIRWTIRVGLYFGFMTDKYPPFSGKE